VHDGLALFRHGIACGGFVIEALQAQREEFRVQLGELAGQARLGAQPQIQVSPG